MAFNTTKNDKDFNLRYKIRPFENNSWDNTIYQTPNLYFLPFFGHDFIKPSDSIDAILDKYRNYFENQAVCDRSVSRHYHIDRFHQMSNEEKEKYQEFLCPYDDCPTKSEFPIGDCMSRMSNIMMAYARGLYVQSVNENQEDEEFVNKINNQLDKSFYKFAQMYLNPNNGGFLLNGAALGVVLSSRFRIYKSRENNEVGINTQNAYRDGHNGTEYWANIYDESLKIIKEGYYKFEELPFVKALSQVNDRCLLMDTIAKILWKQPRSAKLHGHKSITDDMIKLDRIVDDKHGFSMELGNLLNNAINCETPITPDVQKSLLKLNKRITSDNYTPDRNDFNELLNDCVKVTKSQPKEKRTDISYKYKGKSKPTTDYSKYL